MYLLHSLQGFLMHTLYTQLKNIFLYAGLETFIYQTLLVIHQIMLYRYVDISFYGIISAVFSTIYLSTIHINLGLDMSIAPLFSTYKNSYIYFKQITEQIIANIVFGLCASIVMHHIGNHSPFLTQSQFVMCCMLAISETTKKSLKSILHLLLAHRDIMIIEVTGLCIYIVSVWTLLLYSCNGEPSVTIIFAPLLVTSCSTVLVYSHIYIKHIALLATYTQTHVPITSDMLILRIQHYVYQAIRSLYSPNLLVSLIAFNDIKLAAMLKIISVGLHAINTIIRYIFGITSSVLFSHTRNNIQQARAIFMILHRSLYKVLACIGMILLAHHYLFFSHLSYHHATIIYLFLLLALSEDLTITYEHFFIIEKQALFLIVCYATIMTPVLLLLTGLQYNHIDYLLPILIAMRSIYLVMIYYYKQYYFTYIAPTKNHVILDPIYNNKR